MQKTLFCSDVMEPPHGVSSYTELFPPLIPLTADRRARHIPRLWPKSSHDAPGIECADST